MSRRERRNAESYGKENKFILLGIILVVVLAFVASYVIYSKAIANRTGMRVENSQVISKASDNKMINLISNTQEVTSSIGKSVNEIKNNAVDETHVAVNTSKQEEKNNQADVKKNSKNKEVKSTEGQNTEITVNKANEEEKLAEEEKKKQEEEQKALEEQKKQEEEQKKAEEEKKKQEASSSKSFEIVDTSLSDSSFNCPQVEEVIYKDSKYTYSLPCQKSDHIVVKYSDGSVEMIKTALNNGNIKITDLKKFNIQ